MTKYTNYYKGQPYSRYIKYQSTVDFLRTHNAVHPDFQSESSHILGKPSAWLRVDGRQWKRVIVTETRFLQLLDNALSFQDMLLLYMECTEDI